LCFVQVATTELIAQTIRPVIVLYHIRG